MTNERETERLIDRLAAGLEAVRPLEPPAIRLARWLSLALPFGALAVLLISPRPDLIEKLGDLRFLAEQGAALATAVTAAFAAFCLAVPGRDRRVALLPLVPGGLWVATLGAGCLADWLRAGGAGLRLTPDAACLAYIALIGSVPAISFVVMLRRAAPVAPRATLFLAVLASAAVGNFGLRFFHLQDAGLMVLVWQFGSVMLLAALAGLWGPRFLFWRHRDA